MKILLVDDDVGSLRGMQLALIMLKHDCDAFSDPVEAVNNYLQRNYDLVITDLYMPVISGFDLAGMIREVAPAAKIIFVSGYSVEMMKKDDAGEDRLFLNKPVDFSQLKQMLDCIYEASQPDRRL